MSVQMYVTIMLHVRACPSRCQMVHVNVALDMTLAASLVGTPTKKKQLKSSQCFSRPGYTPKLMCNSIGAAHARLFAARYASRVNDPSPRILKCVPMPSRARRH